MKKYEFLLFDFDGTLVDYDRTERWSLAEAFRQAGIAYHEKSYLPEYTRINAEMWKDFEKGVVSAPELRVKRFRILFQACGIEGNPELVAALYVSNLSGSAFLFDDVLPLLEKLRPRYKLGLITNGLKEAQRKRLALSGAGMYMDGVAVSDEIGIQKPDPGIFEYALRDAGHADRKTTLVIGDSLSSDIQGGINFGIDTCWFNPKGKTGVPEIVPTYEIRRLPELLGILGEENH
ncbi:MAG: YjjG family noncanonical pyrimidine nucleotidase [Spirochaetia bacterium]|jgi:putative hydrolase of the HAD superfamily|nr:YjjG family noncanonical pyrimidine nucleotidase [Spirochaetia bacterium]